MLRNYNKHICLLIILLFASYSIVHAGIITPDPLFDADAPVDGGLSLLIAAGLGYGIKRVKRRNKNADPKEE